MMYAEHIIGLLPRERDCADDPAVVAAVRARFVQILHSGQLRARGARTVGQDGSIFELDVLAGDGQYVFLSYGPRYREVVPTALCFGFLFDANTLICQHNALVGPDMANAYDCAIDEAASTVVSLLPPLPAAADAEIAEFMQLMGESDPGMAAYIQQQSTSRYHDLCDAIRNNDRSAPGGAQAIDIFLARAQAAQEELRLAWPLALDALVPGVEILVQSPLPLSAAVGVIEAGELRLF